MTNGSCNCEACKDACCYVPGWFAPDEAMRAIKAGLASQMSVVIEGLNGIEALAPSIEGYEGEVYLHQLGRCTLFDGKGCLIHDSGFKPIECRTGFGCNPGMAPSVQNMWTMWQMPDGHAAVDLWRSTMEFMR